MQPQGLFISTKQERKHHRLEQGEKGYFIPHVLFLAQSRRMVNGFSSFVL